MSEKKLKMTFAPYTIEHLGGKMYSFLPNAVAELVANAYDAAAKNVYIRLTDGNGQKSITVEDDGNGMTFDEINDKFLRIGRKRRGEETVEIESGSNRRVTGRKGLGKLALFGIGDTMEITTRKNGKKTTFSLRWEDIVGRDGEQQTDYEPTYTETDCSPEEKGTTIHMTDLKRRSAFDPQGLAAGLARLFNLFDCDFKVFVVYNDETPISVDQTLRYAGIEKQFTWCVPGQLPEARNDYDRRRQITGEIFTSPKPLPPALRGVTLFANGRMANKPEFFDVAESSHAFSYMTGYLNVDFIDELSNDVIATDRQALEWDSPEPQALRVYLKAYMGIVEQAWRTARREAKTRRIRGGTQSGRTQSGRTQSGRTQSGRTQSGGTQSGGTQSGGTQSGGTQSGGTCGMNMPEEIARRLTELLNQLLDSNIDDEISIEIYQTAERMVGDPYPFHNLHEEIQAASRSYYTQGQYYHAVFEAYKRYNRAVQLKSGSTRSDRTLFQEIFRSKNENSPKDRLSVTNAYDNHGFCESTLNDMEEGQKFLSVGIACGARNPMGHEEMETLESSGLFTKDDCLACLGLLSHLYRRLDQSVLIQAPAPTT